MLTKFARIGSIVAAMVLGSTGLTLAGTSATPATSTGTVVAQASPAPTASPDPFTWRGQVRAYDFTRQNAYSAYGGALGGPKSKPNQSTEANSISLHGDYTFADSGFGIGASYLYSLPGNGCSSAASHFPQSNANQCAGAGFSAVPGNNNVYQDDTLPGYSLSTLYEAYLSYKGNGLNFKGGDMVGWLPWAPASDSRLKPVSYEGADVQYALNKNWAVEGADFFQWECRTCANFDRYTLLTEPNIFPYGGTSAGIASNYLDPSQGGISNNGFFFGRIGYTGPKTLPLTANVSYYAFNQIADLLWVDAKLPLPGTLKPFVALQFGSESNENNYTVPGTTTSTGILGNISSTVFGAQAGFNPLKNITLTAGFDSIPIKTAVIGPGGVLPNGQKVSTLIKGCTAGQFSFASNYNVNLPYFLPGSGTGQCSKNADGSYNVYYGGLASPYTDSYATDPLFTTQLTQGMVDRRSPGTSYKVQATFTSDDKRFVSYVSQAWYDYNNGAIAQGTMEFNFDALYYFSKLPKSGSYKGFLFRYRYGDRDESNFPGAAAPALFKYNRFQAEYDF